jgi:hypothetical protein
MRMIKIIATSDVYFAELIVSEFKAVSALNQIKKSFTQARQIQIKKTMPNYLPPESERTYTRWEKSIAERNAAHNFDKTGKLRVTVKVIE